MVKQNGFAKFLEPGLRQVFEDQYSTIHLDGQNWSLKPPLQPIGIEEVIKREIEELRKLF